MFGFLRKLLGKPAAAPAVKAPAEPVPPATVPRNGAAGHRVNGRPAESTGLKLPLQPILNGLPAELHSRITQPLVGEQTVAIPLERILPQLSHGVVKIQFGELRQAAPQVFSSNPDRDQVQITVPLGVIVPHLNPRLLTCRKVQRQVEVPDEIHSPFDLQGQGLTLSSEPAKPAPVAAPVRQTVPPAHLPPLASPPGAPGAANRVRIISSPTPPPPTGLPLVAPALAPANRGGRVLHPGAAEPVPAPAPVPAPSAPAHTPPAPSVPAVPAAPPAPAAAPKANVEPGSALMVGVSLLSTGWPEAIRKELAQLNLADARVALPHDALEPALKTGRVAFTWQTVRSWIVPALPPGASAHDQVTVELPLRILAPLFLARVGETTRSHRKVAVDPSIPNLFFGLPQPEAPPAVEAAPAAAKPADTNFYTREKVVNSSPGTKFVAKLATPNEVVSRAAALDGVAGALIALPDGLLVASRLAPDLNADTLAAFLPQIFAKVSQSTKELRMGELNNLHFTVGDIPWKIFRVNAIYFAAFGRPGGPLPTGQLAALAAELDHRPK